MAEPLGRNQAMKAILGQAMEDEFDLINRNLVKLRLDIRNAHLPEEKLKILKFNANELIRDLQKELMREPADSRISNISPRRNEIGTPDSAD